MSLTSQIEIINALGRQNLENKGVTTDGTETTYQIMSKIADVTGGGTPNIKEYMEYDTAGTDFVKFSYYSAGTKTIVASKINDGKSVVAGVYNNNMLTIYCIALDPQTADCATLTGGSTTTFSYKGHAHYIGWRGVFNSSTSPASRESYVWTNQCETFELSDIGATSASDVETIGTYILDYYFTVEKAPNPLEYATRLYYLYQKSVFPDNYELKIDAPYATEVTGLLNDASGITKLTLKGNNNGSAINFSQLVRGCVTIVELDFTNFIVKPTNINLMCSNAKELKTIKGEIDLTECTNNTSAFVYCYALEDIEFKENSIKLSINFANSTMLSSESVQSIIDGLATVETAQTLTLSSAIVLTDEQKSNIQAKGWTLVQ